MGVGNIFRPDRGKLNYEDMLSVRVVEERPEGKSYLRFCVSENFSIFITNDLHEDIASRYGVDMKETLAEGYIYFGDDDKIKDGEDGFGFKDSYRYLPAANGGSAHLAQLPQAVERVIRKAFDKM